MRKILLLTILLLCSLSEAKQKPKSRPVERQEPSVLHYDVTENKVIYEKNVDTVRSMASLTKLMTAMVALDYDSTMNRQLTLKKGVSTSLPYRSYTRGELFHAMLIRSDNAAAETIANDFPGGRESFIREMNFKSAILGMKHTSFNDPTGLNIGNKSTANDIYSMVVAASDYEFIRNTSVKNYVSVQSFAKKKPRQILLRNTNHLILHEVNDVAISKTGFTNPAGFCVAILVESKDFVKVSGDRIDKVKEFFTGVDSDRIEIVPHKHVIVVMGARNSKDRMNTVKNIVYNNVIS